MEILKHKRIEFYYVDEQEMLVKACQSLSKEKIIAVDLECENNLHHFGSYISLIQISAVEKNYVFDILRLKELTPLIRLMHSESVQKIFHDVSFDLRILNSELNCKPKNIFDTQIAALLLGKKEVGLASLLKHYFGINKEEKFQMANWTKRPLSNEKLNYAVKDTAYLIKLRNILRDELKRADRLSWSKEEFSAIEKADLEYKEGTYLDVRGVKQLSPKERALFRRLFNVRKILAKKVNRPVYFIINNKELVALAKKPYKRFDQWKNIKHTHPIVRRKARLFYEAVSKSKNEVIHLNPKKKLKLTMRQRNLSKNLSEARDEASTKIGIQGYLLLNKEQHKTIVRSLNFNCLRNWQRSFIKL